MESIQFEAENGLVDEFNLISVRDLSYKYDESGIEYVVVVDDEEQKELEDILNSLSNDDKKVAFSKTIEMKI